jgi:hypothetical protein
VSADSEAIGALARRHALDTIPCPASSRHRDTRGSSPPGPLARASWSPSNRAARDLTRIP